MLECHPSLKRFSLKGSLSLSISIIQTLGPSRSDFAIWRKKSTRGLSGVFISYACTMKGPRGKGRVFGGGGVIVTWGASLFANQEVKLKRLFYINPCVPLSRQNMPVIIEMNISKLRHHLYPLPLSCNSHVHLFNFLPLLFFFLFNNN